MTLPDFARKLDPRRVLTFLAGLNRRDAGHFISAFALAFVSLTLETNQPLTKAVWLAALPAAATVAFRQVWPNQSS